LRLCLPLSLCLRLSLHVVMIQNIEQQDDWDNASPELNGEMDVEIVEVKDSSGQVRVCGNITAHVSTRCISPPRRAAAACPLDRTIDLRTFG